MIAISMHSGAFSSRKCALISIIHTAESAQVKAVLVRVTVFLCAFVVNRRERLFWSSL